MHPYGGMGQRAKISNQTDRWNAVCGATSLGRPVASLQAVQEARAILAETEPETGTSYFGRIPGFVKGGGAVPLCEIALAEALAAFVED